MRSSATPSSESPSTQIPHGPRTTSSVAFCATTFTRLKPAGLVFAPVRCAGSRNLRRVGSPIPISRHIAGTDSPSARRVRAQAVTLACSSGEYRLVCGDFDSPSISRFNASVSIVMTATVPPAGVIVRTGAARIHAWARAHGIDGRSLNAWRVNLERRGKPARRVGPRLVELVPAITAGSSSRYVLHIGNLELELGDDFNEQTLRRLVVLLKSC